MAARDTFRTQIRSAIRGLWSGVLDKAQFKSAMQATIDRSLRRAWNDGALECGIKVTDLTDEEQDKLDAVVLEQFKYIASFGDDIADANKKSGAKVQPLFDRAEMWVNQYDNVRNLAKTTVCEDEKLEWILGPTEEHCPDCSWYAGKVYRASVWNKWGVRPQSRSLACHGYNCLCQLRKTDKPVTRGKPKGMTG